MADRPVKPLPARTYSVTIARDWRQVYEAIWRPEAFAHWAAGMAKGNLRQEKGRWLDDGPDGPIEIRFTPHNDFGVMDHFVDPGDGAEVEVPLRVAANGSGAEVLLTLYRQPGMSDGTFARDARWINRDLRALKAWVEKL